MLLAVLMGMANTWALQMSAEIPQRVTRTSSLVPPFLLKPLKVNPANIESTELTFAELFAEHDMASLHGSDASLSITLPVSARRNLHTAQLSLRGTLSNVLIAPSQLVVSVNEQVIGQLHLNGNASKLNVDMPVPVGALKPGYNRIRLQAIQHYGEGCETPLAPELWTQLDLEKSHFTLTSSARSTPLLLDNLNQVFDKTTWLKRPELHVLTHQAPTLGQLQAMSAVVQGVALRYEYVPIKVFTERYQEVWPAQGQVVLLGTRAELAPWLAELNVPSTETAVLAVRALPGDATRNLVLLAADDEAQLLRLAQVFALHELPLPNLAWVSLAKFDLPKLANLPAVTAVRAAAQTVIPLQALGYKTQTLRGFDVAGESMNFWNDRWQGRVQMRVHLAYAAGMSPQSAMNVLVNNVLVGSIPLNDDKVGQYHDYSVSVPSTALNAGWNKLELKPVLIPLAQGGKCSPFFLGNLAVTVYDDSTLERLGGSSLDEPDLSLFAHTGEVSLSLSPEPLTLALLDNDVDTLSAGLTLVAKLTQVQKRPLWHVSLALGAPDEQAGAAWVVGKKSLLPAAAQSHLVASTHYALPLPVASAPLGNSAYTWLSPAWRDFFELTPPAAQHTRATVELSADLSEQVFAMAYARRAGDWTVFSAETPALLAHGIDTLTGFGHWGQLNGKLAFWHPEDSVVHTIPVEVTPISAFGLRGGLGIFASQHPWFALFALLLLIAVLVWLIPRLLKLYRVRRHPAP
ncbi:MAG: cellulose biosynthesis cyclic di-GMP-binding regulatory protein BcsB [Sideroxydans sp.]|nr:cellulose biosynthesis cyclic di-GMP-binding regulatory protein BcsB [Sideroxydans sp.]